MHIADSITKLDPSFRGSVLVAGSHGGRYCGYLAALAGLRGVILNDAGVGKDQAGIGSLAYLEPLGIAAATVAHTSARIGDGGDMLERGRISHCNASARRLGCRVGDACADAVDTFCGGTPFEGEAPPYTEARFEFREGVIGCDSASLVRPEDEGLVIVTGSHGGTLAGRPGYGLAVVARGAVFNDAGVGIDDAGIGRLPVLDEAGVPAVTVAAATARIGDARSAWESGIISHVNRRAAGEGVQIGMTVPRFAEQVLG